MEAKKFMINIILVIFLVFTIIGTYWLSRLQIEAGPAYLFLLVIGIIFIVVATLARKHEVFWFEIPIDKSTERSLLMFFLGMVSIGIIFVVSSTIKLQIFSPFLMAPLAFGSLSIGAETFAALKAATSPFWTFFISVISASTIEEIVLGWGFVVMGSLLLGFGLRKLLKLDFSDKGNNYFDFFMAVIFSVIMFAVLHVFNSTYLNADGSINIQMFMYAAIFRFVLNIFIYKFGSFGLLFSIGVHAVNNAVFIGRDIVLKALFSFPGGVILIGIIVLFIAYSIISFKDMVKEGKLAGKEFLSFD
jgi:membrane protease YdiL (CAAX protease family)